MKALIALVLGTAPAVASGHHGGSHGTTTTSTSWNGSATSIGYVALPAPTYVYVTRAAPSCIESSDVVGARECMRFGAWSQNLQLPSLFVDAGMHVRRFPMTFLSGTGGSAVLSRNAMMSAMRVGVGLPHHLYAALEGELGGVAMPAMGPDVMPDQGMFLAGYGVVGARAGTEHALISVELAGGGRSVAAVAEMADASGTVLETRARGEVWLGPWASLGATIGASLVERGDWMAGLYLGVHSRAFGGGR